MNVSYESFYNGNDNLVITAQFFNKTFEFDKTANLEIVLKNKDEGQLLNFPFILKNTNYQVDLSGMPAGDYEFTVKSLDENISMSGSFKILDYNVEQHYLNANVLKLQNVATYSQGKAYFIDETSTFINHLMTDERFATVQKSSKNVVPLIDWKFLLAFIAFSLSAEWFIRKYTGLI